MVFSLFSSAPKDPVVQVDMGKNQSWKTARDGLDKLELEEGEVPSPGDGEVLVKVLTVSLNYRDVEVCTGEYGHHASLEVASSLTPCSDMCGIVVATKSAKWKEGDRVLSTFNQSHVTGQVTEKDLATGLGFPLDGVLTRYRVFPAEGLVRPPSYLAHEEASTLPIAAVTAWMSINQFRALGDPIDHSAAKAAGKKNKKEKGEDGGEGGDEEKDKPTVLLQGTGGVAIAGLQIARAAGFQTVITSSSDDKLARAKELGASRGINYRTHWEWEGQVLESTGGRGADFILETGGANTLRKSFDCVTFGGTISCIGYLGGKDNSPELSRLNVNVLALRRNVTLKGVLNGPRDRFEEMLRFYEDKKIKPVVDKVFPFEEAKEAFDYLAKGSHFGKVVIKVGEE